MIHHWTKKNSVIDISLEKKKSNCYDTLDEKNSVINEKKIDIVEWQLP